MRIEESVQLGLDVLTPITLIVSVFLFISAKIKQSKAERTGKIHDEVRATVLSNLFDSLNRICTIYEGKIKAAETTIPQHWKDAHQLCNIANVLQMVVNDKNITIENSFVSRTRQDLKNYLQGVFEFLTQVNIERYHVYPLLATAGDHIGADDVRAAKTIDYFNNGVKDLRTGLKHLQELFNVNYDFANVAYKLGATEKDIIEDLKVRFKEELFEKHPDCLSGIPIKGAGNKYIQEAIINFKQGIVENLEKDEVDSRNYVMETYSSEEIKNYEIFSVAYEEFVILAELSPVYLDFHIMAKVAKEYQEKFPSIIETLLSRYASIVQAMSLVGTNDSANLSLEKLQERFEELLVRDRV